MHGLEEVIAKVNAEDKLLLIDDVFDTGNSMKAVLLRIQAMARKNTPEIRSAWCATPHARAREPRRAVRPTPPNLPRARSLWYKPSANQTDITPRYWLRETDAWIVFPHELEGLTIDEIGAKWDPQIAEIVKAPGGPFAPK